MNIDFTPPGSPHSHDEAEGSDTPCLSIDDVLDLCGTGKFQWRLLLIAGLAFAGDAVEVCWFSSCSQTSPSI